MLPDQILTPLPTSSLLVATVFLSHRGQPHHHQMRLVLMQGCHRLSTHRRTPRVLAIRHAFSPRQASMTTLSTCHWLTILPSLHFARELEAPTSQTLRTST